MRRMLKNKNFLFILMGILFVLLVILQHYAPKRMSWDLNLKSSAKTPYGGFVMRHILPEIFPDAEVGNNSLSFYEGLNKYNDSRYDLIVLTPHFSPDRYDREALLEFVAQGNIVFLSSLTFNQQFMDTLGFDVSAPVMDSSALGVGKISLNLLNPALKKRDGYTFERTMPQAHFTRFDSSSSRQIGINEQGMVNYISTQYGSGRFLLHCQPLPFTNYHILYSQNEYYANCLTYLNGEKILWDSYYKPGNVPNVSPVRYILTVPALRNAYYLLLFGILMYLFFGGKRRQRPVPIFYPPENTTLDFIKTTGNLFYSTSNHKNIAIKISLYFRDFLKSRYYLTKIEYDEATINHLTAKSGIERRDIMNLFDRMKAAETSKETNVTLLSELNDLIERFKNNCN